MITHEEAKNILMGSDKEQTETITLELLIKKLSEYEKGRMILLTTEEYEKLIAYIAQQQSQEQRLKKVEELMELYKKISGYESDMSYVYGVIETIKKYSVDKPIGNLEEEYKETKKGYLILETQIQQLEKELNLWKKAIK